MNKEEQGSGRGEQNWRDSIALYIVYCEEKGNVSNPIGDRGTNTFFLFTRYRQLFRYEEAGFNIHYDVNINGAKEERAKLVKEASDKQVVNLMKERIKNINLADKTATCAHDAVSETLGIDNEHLSHSSGLATSKEGASVEDIQKLYSENGIGSIKCSIQYAVNQLTEFSSDRAVVCLANSDRIGHAVPVILENSQLIVKSEGQKMTLEAYRAANGYDMDAIVIVPRNVNAETLSDIKYQTNKNRIVKAAYPIGYVGQGDGMKFGAKPGIQIGDGFEVDSNAKPDKDEFDSLRHQLSTNKKAGILTETKNLIKGFRLDKATNKNAWEIQKNGISGGNVKTTIAVVHYPSTLYKDLDKLSTAQSKVPTEEIKKRILTALHISLYTQKKITLTQESFPSLYNKNRQNHGDVTQVDLRETSLDYWLDYDEACMNNLLTLRLQSEVENINTCYDINIIKPGMVISTDYYDLESQIQLMTLIKEIGSIYATKVGTQIILAPILAPESSLIYHWLGIALVKRGESINIVYLDSENRVAKAGLVKDLLSLLQQSHPQSQILFNQLPVEQQRYNNCGSEVIENFIYYLTGTRTTQEAAVYVHSLLVENTLLDPVEYQSKIVQNNKLIAFLTNNDAIPIEQLVTSEQELLYAIAHEIDHSFRLINDNSAVTEKKSIISVEKFTDLKYYPNIPKVENVLPVLAGSTPIQVNYASRYYALIDKYAAIPQPAINADKQEHSVPLFAEESLSTTLIVAGNSERENVESEFRFIGNLNHLVKELINLVMKNNYLRGKILNYVYRDELAKVNEVLNKNYIRILPNNNIQKIREKHPFDWSQSDFRKITAVLHPDKARHHIQGYNEDDYTVLLGFITENNINNIKENDIKVSQDRIEMLPKQLEIKFQKLQPAIQKISLYAKRADIGIDLVKLYIKPNAQHVISVVYDSALLYNKLSYGLSSGQLILITTPISSLYSLYYGEYIQAGFQAVHGFSYYALDKNMLSYGASIFLGLNAITTAYEFYEGKYVAGVLQILGVVGIYLAPTITGTAYALYYTGQNVYGIYEIYQEAKNENIMSFNRLISNLVLKSITGSDIKNFLEKVSLESRLSEVGINNINIVDNTYLDGQDKISLVDIKDQLQSHNKLVINQINKVNALETQIEEKLKVIADTVGFTSYFTSDADTVTKLETEILVLLEQGKVNYDKIEAAIVAYEYQISWIYNSHAKYVNVVFSRLEQKVNLLKQNEPKNDHNQYYHEQEAVIVEKHDEQLKIIQVSPYALANKEYCDKLQKENAEKQLFKEIICERIEYSPNNSKLHLPVKIGIDEATIDALTPVVKNDASYYWNVAHKSKIAEGLANLANSEQLINKIIYNITQTHSWVVPGSLVQETVTNQAKQTDVRIFNYVSSFFVQDNRNLSIRLQEKLKTENEAATIIKLMSLNKEGCSMHGYVLDSNSKVLNYELVESANSELCKNEITAYMSYVVDLEIN